MQTDFVIAPRIIYCMMEFVIDFKFFIAYLGWKESLNLTSGCLFFPMCFFDEKCD